MTTKTPKVKKQPTRARREELLAGNRWHDEMQEYGIAGLVRALRLAALDSARMCEDAGCEEDQTEWLRTSERPRWEALAKALDAAVKKAEAINGFDD